MISGKTIEEVKSLPIRDVLQAVLGVDFSIDKNGKIARCPNPYHKDTKPSFAINVTENYGNCFACDLGGDAISIIQTVKNLPFVEAVKTIAETFNISIEYENQNFKPGKSLLTQLAEEWNRELLENPQHRKILDYLLGRGLTLDNIKKNLIGYCPGIYSFNNWLHKRFGNNPDFMETARKHFYKVGIINVKVDKKTGEKKESVYFTGRITFPFIEQVGDKVIGFTARATEEKQVPKYLISKTSELFKKQEVVYSPKIFKNKNYYNESVTIVVEGQIDSLLLAQNGFDSIAITGSAPSKKQLSFAKRENIVLAFDGDDAGYKATKKAIDISFTINDKGFYVLNMPEGKDVADLIKDNQFSIDNKEDYLTWYFKDVESRLEHLDSVKQKKVFDEIIGLFNKIQDPFKKGIFVKKIKNLWGVDVANLPKENFLESNSTTTIKESQEIIQDQSKSFNKQEIIKMEMTELNNSFQKILYNRHKENNISFLNNKNQKRRRDFFREILADAKEIFQNPFKEEVEEKKGETSSVKVEIEKQSDEVAPIKETVIESTQTTEINSVEQNSTKKEILNNLDIPKFLKYYFLNEKRNLPDEVNFESLLYQFLKSDEVKNLIKTDAFGKFSKDFYIEMFIESFLGPDELFFEFLNILKNKKDIDKHNKFAIKQILENLIYFDDGQISSQYIREYLQIEKDLDFSSYLQKEKKLTVSQKQTYSFAKLANDKRDFSLYGQIANHLVPNLTKKEHENLPIFEKTASFDDLMFSFLKQCFNTSNILKLEDAMPRFNLFFENNKTKFNSEQDLNKVKRIVFKFILDIYGKKILINNLLEKQDKKLLATKMYEFLKLIQRKIYLYKGERVLRFKEKNDNSVLLLEFELSDLISKFELFRLSTFAKDSEIWKTGIKYVYRIKEYLKDLQDQINIAGLKCSETGNCFEYESLQQKVPFSNSLERKVYKSEFIKNIDYFDSYNLSSFFDDFKKEFFENHDILHRIKNISQKCSNEIESLIVFVL
jgi:DNA primase